MNDSPERAPRQWLRSLRKILRRVRWCAMSLTLIVVGVLVYFATHDLPDSVKQKLETELRAHGVDLRISHLRWRIERGFVAENVEFGSAQMAAGSPRLSIKEVELKLSPGALRRFKFNEIDSLVLNDGKFIWPLTEPGQPAEALVLTNLQARLLLLTNDQWELDNFTAAFAGVTLHLAGTVTNASAFRDWKIFQGKPGAQPGDIRERLRRIVRTADVIKFAKPPELNVIIRGDARDPQSFRSEITLEASGAVTPWGNLNNGQLSARLTPPATNRGPMQLEFKLRADEVDTRWGGAGHFHAQLHAAGEESLTNVVHARLEITAQGVDTPWIQATNAHFTAQWNHSLTNPLPADGAMELLLTTTRTPWATADEFQLDGRLSTPATNEPARADESWGWWGNLEPLTLAWNCRFTEIRAGDFESKQLACSGNWSAPELTITNLHTEMYRGRLDGSANLDVSTRAVRFDCSSDFDVQKADPFLTPGGREWFRKQAFTWDKPPVARASGSAVLPPWSNRSTNWSSELRESLNLQGSFAVGYAGFREVPVSSAQSHFSYSNLVWSLPDLVVVRPEGTARLALQSDDRSKDFYCHIDSGVDVKALRGLLETNAQKVLDSIRFSQPPLIDMDLWGNWHDLDRTGFKGRVAVTNFTFRGESANVFRGTLAYTNRFLLLTHARVERPEGYATATGVGVDFARKRAFLTNGFGNMEPLPLIHTLGPKITSIMSPYRFAKPPTISAHGVIPLSEDTTMTDLHFKIEGGPYEWMKFHSAHVAGTVDWVGETLHLGLAESEFYGGTLAGVADFDFTRKIGADFTFDMTTTDANLKRLLGDLTSESTNVEGTLSGRLIVTKANSEDPKESWFGNGWVELKDGLIWEIPIFGVLSPVLDSFQKGLGESRAREARGTFTITNSVIRSEDMEIRFPALRILYRGTVGFDTKVDATEEAELGRDTPLVGPVVSSILLPFTKVFEYKVTGTLKHPKSEPNFILTKAMLKPFSFVWDMLKDLRPGESTPAPAPPPLVPPPPAPAPPK